MIMVGGSVTSVVLNRQVMESDRRVGCGSSLDSVARECFSEDVTFELQNVNGPVKQSQRKVHSE